MSTTMWADNFHSNFLMPNPTLKIWGYCISRRRPSPPSLTLTLLSATMPSAATLLGDPCILRYSFHLHLFKSILIILIPSDIQKHNTSGPRMLCLPLLYHLCRLSLPGRLSLNKRLFVVVEFCMLSKKSYKTVFNCQYFQFLLQKASSVQCNGFHSIQLWQLTVFLNNLPWHWISSSLDIE